jgi:uncharacterized protein
METSNRTINLNSRKNSLLIVLGAAVIFAFIFAYQMIYTRDTYLKDMDAFRAEKDQMFKSGTESPLPDSAKASFQKLDYFPLDRMFRVNAKLVKHPKHEIVKMPQNKPGKVDEYLIAGKLTFTLNGQNLSLTAYQMNKRDSESLFVPFRDATNGKTTYGGGRYLEHVNVVNGKAELDFNKAYNPYCVYNYDFVCPVPPVENTLPIEITAGEKNYH